MPHPLIEPTRIYIDGYNVLHKNPRLARLLKSDADAARRSLVEALSSRRKRGIAISIVFDSFGDPIAAGSGVEVVFAGTRTADSWIRMRVEKELKIRTILVVSSDLEVARHASAMGAAVSSAEDFLASRPPARSADEDEKPPPRLSRSELDEWLALFSGERP